MKNEAADPEEFLIYEKHDFSKKENAMFEKSSDINVLFNHMPSTLIITLYK